jgi:hypothetical protein
MKETHIGLRNHKRVSRVMMNSSIAVLNALTRVLDEPEKKQK